MSTFSSLFQSGTAFYGDPFGPIIDTITDFGYSLLPQYPGFVRPPVPAGTHAVYPDPPIAIIPPLPVVYRDEGPGIESETTYVPPVLPGPARSAPSAVPREIVVVEGLPTEVERHPEGDFPAGSIFAPGQTWGGGIEQLDREEPPQPEEPDVALSDILDWGLDTLAGQQPWQMTQWGGVQQQPSVMNLVAPSGIPGQPSQVGGQYVGPTTPGDSCGNRRYVTLDRETGKISCKRRRRRRLLTNRDLADLASLKTITGGGAALNAAVIRAVR